MLTLSQFSSPCCVHRVYTLSLEKGGLPWWLAGMHGRAETRHAP